MLTTRYVQNALPALPVVLPLLGAALLAGLRKYLPRAAADTIALACAGAQTAVCALLLMGAQFHTLVYWFGNWYPRGSIVLGIAFVIDPVSAGMATLCAALTLLALLFSWHHVDSGANHFQPLMLVFLAGMSGFCLTGDLFNLFVFFELMSTAAFALTGLKTGEPAPLQGAFNFAVTNTIAAFLVLIGIAFLYAVTGALNMAQIGLALQHRHDPLVLFACALITCGFLTKAATVPFHFWLADAHAVSPTPVCVLLSGIMVELGLYAVLRIYATIFLPALDQRAHPLTGILLVFGVGSAIYGGLMCYAEHHLKRLLAFSTISHAGLMLIAIALQGPVATAGFLLYLAGHAFVKSSLFFVSGLLLHHFRTASEPALFRRARHSPATAAMWFLGGLGLAGFPAFATSLGEGFTSDAAQAHALGWISWIFVVSGLLTAGAVFRVGFHTFFGWGSEPISDRAALVDEMPETDPAAARTPWYLAAPPTLCLVAAAAITFFPGFRAGVVSSATRLASPSAYLHAVYTSATLPVLASSSEVHWTPILIHGLIASMLAMLLALTSVFRKRLSRGLRLGPVLEGPLFGLRTLQSGQIGDYVLWMTVGIATLGSAYVVFLR